MRRALAGALGMLALQLPFAPARASDLYTIDNNFSRPDTRDRYTRQLLQAALDASSAQFGPYQLRTSPLAMERDRLMQEMVKGTLVNLSAQITSVEWEQKLIPIRIPLDKGLSGYRVSLIDRRHQAQFDAVRTLEQLKRIPLGAGRQWSSTAVFQQAGFPVALGNSTPGLHSMLAADRFRHFPRGMEEAVFELMVHGPAFPELALERGFAIYMPLPRYFFVSPGQARLAERLEYGLRALIADGRFDQMFHEFYDAMIERVGLRKRRLFKLDNPLLTPQTPLSNKAYWYDPFEHR
ncbi:hypothetical protein [Pseudoduganella namucuonensis]|uniref:Transporter substrate-binding domain-containing protein n=1 Tax=Pseudoduganella namucuonensis TaxID=1035707 RepID=A0A1I7KZK5_9BURK|nr:hypothetical protein [Pseudoduganella namucuonensis]SFV02818.1 hypothetical protein SAMN05216552_102168 [Pseudoduganella namucuonensis]